MTEQKHDGQQGAAKALAAAAPLLRVNLISLIADRLECNSARLMVAAGQDLQAVREKGLDEEERAGLVISASAIRETCAQLRQVAEAMSCTARDVDAVPEQPGMVLILGSASQLEMAAAAGLCLAMGRACLVSGNPLAVHSRAFVDAVIRGALMDLQLPEDALLWLEDLDRLEEGAFAAVHMGLGQVVWLGKTAMDPRHMEKLDLPFVWIQEAASLPEALKGLASKNLEGGGA